MKGAIQQHLNMSSVEKAVVWEGTVITRHVTCGKPLTVLSFAVSIQLPKNLIWHAGRMVWQVKAHVALPDVLGSLQLPLMPASEGSNALFGHLSASGLTCTYSHRDIVLENTSLKKNAFGEQDLFTEPFKDPLQLCTNLLAAKSRSRALNGNREVVLLAYVNMTQVSVIREDPQLRKMPHQN